MLTKSQKRYFTKSNHRYIPFSIKEPFPLCHSHSTIGCATAAFPWQGISGSALNSGVEFFDSLRRRTSFWHEQLLVWCFLVLVDLNSLDEAIVYRNDSSKGLNHWITLLKGSTAQRVWCNDPFLKLQWQDLGAMAHYKSFSGDHIDVSMRDEHPKRSGWVLRNPYMGFKKPNPVKLWRQFSYKSKSACRTDCPGSSM